MTAVTVSGSSYRRSASSSSSSSRGRPSRRQLLVALLAVSLVALGCYRYSGLSWDAPSRPSHSQQHAAQQARVCPAYNTNDSPSFAFLHIPKTAGNLLVETIAAMMPADGPARWCKRGEQLDLPETYSTCSSGQPPPEQEALFNLTSQKFLSDCSGFAAHQDAAFFQALGVDARRTITLTALRHPVDRMISDYFYSLKLGAEWLEPYKPANASDFSGLERFVRENSDQLNNFATQLLGGGRHCDWPGAPPNVPAEQLLEAAKRNLERTCVILITEYMEESLLWLASAAGWPASQVLETAVDLEARFRAESGTRVNGNTKPVVPETVRQVIADLNPLDMQLYMHAVQILLQREVK